MKTFLITLAYASIAAAQASPPIEIAVSHNDARDNLIYRGWPLIVRADAALAGESPQALTLDPGTLSVSVYAASGQQAAWPLELTTAFDAAPRLGPDNDSARAVWIVPHGNTSSFEPGRYAIRATWGGVESSPLEVEVKDAPAELTKADRIRLASLRAEAMTLIGDHQSAVDLLNDALAVDPGSVALLSQKALAHERLGQLGAALATANDALARFDEQFPDAGHPPALLLQTQRRIMARLAGGEQQP
jgi:tetratricopeptide (TPR) repeat protein